jgi:o-succinylbenzoate synthase
VIELDDLLARLHVVTLPLLTRFRGVDERECVLFEGTHGWAEFSPFLEYEASEARVWLDAALESAFTPLPSLVRDVIPVNATVPAVPVHEVAHVLSRYDGCSVAKVKVAERGGSLDEDLARVRLVQDLLGTGGRIRVDANGGWLVDEAITAIKAINQVCDLEYVEQPCAAIDELVQVRRYLNGGVLIAADESIRKADDPFIVRDAGAADVAILKVAPLGGVRRALEIAAQIDMPVVVSSELSSSVGLSLGAWLAGALPELPFACGLATADLLAADVVKDPLSPRAGLLPVTRIAADPSLLREHAASAARVQWWHERVTACWKVA